MVGTVGYIFDMVGGGDMLDFWSGMYQSLVSGSR